MRGCARSSHCGALIMLEVVWRPRAQLDRESIALYLGFEQGNPEAALSAMQSIDSVIGRLRRFPESGGRVLVGGLDHDDYRRTHANPYTIYYRFNEATLTVYRVIHQRQDFDVYSLVDLS